MQYYGTRLSENISRREPEGYLLCLNVPVARTGTQEYLPSELGLTGTSLRPSVPVFRAAEEVFSPETIASFEGMPVTDGHPPEGVDVSNIRALQKGHAHNVRRGNGEESDLLLADLIITDPALIDAILRDGKREISCGYTYELCEENGQYIQRKIRGNHVAVVDAGRAGSRVSIRDEQPPVRAGQNPGTDAARLPFHEPIAERRRNTMKKSLSKVLARMAKDGDAETVAGIIEEMLDPAETETVILKSAEEATEGEAPADEAAAAVENAENVIAIDEDGLAGILERLDRIIALLEPPAADEAPAEEAAETIGEALEEAALGAEDPLTGEIAAVMEEILDPVASAVTESGEEEETMTEFLRTEDALRAALTAVRPALARMPGNLRHRVAGDIAAGLRRSGRRRTADSDVYAALASARRRTAPASADLGKRIMEKRNVSYQRGGSRQ